MTWIIVFNKNKNQEVFYHKIVKKIKVMILVFWKLKINHYQVTVLLEIKIKLIKVTYEAIIFNKKINNKLIQHF